MTPPSEERLEALATQVGERLRARGETLATAESCTGGWIGMALTSIAGSSAWYDRGFITYSNAAKEAHLGVPASTLQTSGAVSLPTASAMAEGARRAAGTAWALATTGIAGPDGGSPDKPVGTVCFAWVGPQGLVHVEQRCFSGDRRAIRAQATAHAMEILAHFLQQSSVPS